MTEAERQAAREAVLQRLAARGQVMARLRAERAPLSDAARRGREAGARAEAAGGWGSVAPHARDITAAPPIPRVYADMGMTQDQWAQSWAKMPEGMVVNPETGQATNREMMAGAMAPTRAGTVMGGAAQGGTFGTSDEMAGALGRVVDGPGGGDYAREEARARLEAQRAAYPGTALAAELVGSVALPGVSVANTARGGNVVRGALTGGGAGAAYGFATGEDGAEERTANAVSAGAVGLGLGATIPAVGNALRGVAQRPAVRRAIEAIPSVDDIKAKAGALYDRARANGTAADSAATTSLADRATDLLRDEGMVLPSGGLVDGYPRVAGALSMLREFGGQTMDPSQMLQVRRTLQSAAQSADPAERRVGTMLIRQFDDFTDPLAPEIREANALWRTASQGELIDTTIELAGARAGQFSGSGFENALRTEFRALDRQIVKGQLKVSDEERALIERIARGGTVENIARDLGKAAPRGVVSTGLATGVPFMVGNALGGPVMGGLAAAATTGVGEVARRAATRMQTRNANVLSGVARNGGTMPPVPPTLTREMVDQLERMGMGLAPSLSERLAPPLR